MQLYSCGGMIVQTVLMDMKLDKTVDELYDRTVVNTSAAREHGAEIECQIRTTKERYRAIVSTLPFAILPKLIVTNIAYFVVLWMNAFPVRNGISTSNKYLPQSIGICNRLSWK